MNILKVYNDTISFKQISSAIEVLWTEKGENLPVNRLSLTVLESTELQIEYDSTDKTYLEIVIYIKEGVSFSLGEIRTGSSYKISYRYFLEKKSNMLLNRFHQVEKIKEQDCIFLKGEDASFESVIKTIATDEEKYEMEVLHEAGHTVSKTTHHAVSRENGALKFYITNEVPNGIKGCTIEQKSQIITMNQNKCIIKPILLIEEEDVDAEHAAHIGTASEEDLFYLESRGISRQAAKDLIVKGFLQKELTLIKKEQIETMIKKYWR